MSVPFGLLPIHCLYSPVLRIASTLLPKSGPHKFLRECELLYHVWSYCAFITSLKVVMLLSLRIIDHCWSLTSSMVSIHTQYLQLLPCCSWSSPTYIPSGAMCLLSSHLHSRGNGSYAGVMTDQFVCSTNVVAKWSSACSTVIVCHSLLQKTIAVNWSNHVPFSWDTHPDCGGQSITWRSSPIN